MASEKEVGRKCPEDVKRNDENHETTAILSRQNFIRESDEIFLAPLTRDAWVVFASKIIFGVVKTVTKC